MFPGSLFAQWYSVEPEGCETPCWSPLLKKMCVSRFYWFFSLRLLLPCSMFFQFNWLFGTQHAYEDINLLGAWDTFFKAKPNMLWVGSFLGSFHSTFSAWQSQSLSRSHVWYIFWPWFQSGMFFFDVLDFFVAGRNWKQHPICSNCSQSQGALEH